MKTGKNKLKSSKKKMKQPPLINKDVKKAKIKNQNLPIIKMIPIMPIKIPTLPLTPN
jgi:hypothetical protein